MNELLQELFAAQVFVPAMHFVSKPVSKLPLSLSVCVPGVCLVKEGERVYPHISSNHVPLCLIGFR